MTAKKRHTSKTAKGATVHDPRPNKGEAAMTATVPMRCDPEHFADGPHEADVHPDEVANYAAGGWVKA